MLKSRSSSQPGAEILLNSILLLLCTRTCSARETTMCPAGPEQQPGQGDQWSLLESPLYLKDTLKRMHGTSKSVKEWELSPAIYWTLCPSTALSTSSILIYLLLTKAHEEDSLNITSKLGLVAHQASGGWGRKIASLKPAGLQSETLPQKILLLLTIITSQA
jgi:hypothetical protein